MEKIKVLVVDDSLFIRQILTDILNTDPHIEVVGQAIDGVDALQKLSETAVNVVTLDLDMPRLDGFETLKKIMEMAEPPAVLVVSSYTQKGASITLACLEAGAVDFVLKLTGSATGNLETLGPEVVKKVKIASTVNTSKLKVLYSGNSATHVAVKEPKLAAVVIGSSTGGPVALEHLLPQIPVTFPYPIFVAQHLPATFVESLISLLKGTCALPIKIGKEGEIVQPGIIYFAPGGGDMVVRHDASQRIILSLLENKNILTPSIDKLMESVTSIYKENTLGVILTGMGVDGLHGMGAIKEAKGKTIVQDEKSSVVFGMGKEVIDAGLADTILPLDKIAQKIIDEI